MGCEGLFIRLCEMSAEVRMVGWQASLTLLQGAANRGHIAVVDMLLKAGADKEAKTNDVREN